MNQLDVGTRAVFDLACNLEMMHDLAESLWCEALPEIGFEEVDLIEDSNGNAYHPRLLDSEMMEDLGLTTELPIGASRFAQSALNCIDTICEAFGKKTCYKRMRELAETLGECITAADSVLRHDWLSKEHIQKIILRVKYEHGENWFEVRREMLKESPLYSPEWIHLRQVALDFKKALPTKVRDAFELAEGLTEQAGLKSQSYGSVEQRQAKGLMQSYPGIETLGFDELDYDGSYETSEKAWDLLQAVPVLISKQSSEPPPLRYLELRLDRRAKTVHRGLKSIRMTREVHWNLLERFVQAGNVFSTRPCLELSWGVSTVSRNVLDQELRRLKELIKPLGITIQNERGSGWKLINSSTIAANE